MKHKHLSRLSWLRRLPSNYLEVCSLPDALKGFTLVELLVATMMTGLVVSLAGFGVVTATQANQRTEAIAARRYDLSRAFDFITNEIRMATRINQSQTMQATDASSMSSLLASVGLSASDGGNSSTPVLYLEIPITSPVPNVCPAGGPNAGVPPPQPATYDQVVYDIRPSGKDWLGPNSIYRYGRVPRSNGNIDPCSDPVASDTLVDAIADRVSASPSCPTPGHRIGKDGFQVCVDGTQVDLFMRSEISNVEIHRLSSTATSRTGNSQPTPVLTGTRKAGTNTINLSWQWSGSITGVTFVAYVIDSKTATKTQIYSGASTSHSTEMTSTVGDQHCYIVTATVGAFASPESNSVCFTQ